MTSENRSPRARGFAAALGFFQTLLSNSWRRLNIGGRYLLLFFQHLRLRHLWRQLGKRVHLALEAGEVNPMLTGEVKDSLKAVQALQHRKKAQLEAIQALRQRIRESRSRTAASESSPEERGSGSPSPLGESPGRD